MIYLYKDIEDINLKISSLMKSGDIFDYRIVLNYNSYIDIYIVLGRLQREDFVSMFSHYDRVNLKCYSQEEFHSSDFIESFIFENENKVNITSTRRRLSNLLDPLKAVNNEIPIVTFYSYKGGVGRSTALASCASYLAINYKTMVR